MAERVDHTHRKADQVRGYVDRAMISRLGYRYAGEGRGARRYCQGRSAPTAIGLPSLPRGRTWAVDRRRGRCRVAFKGLSATVVANGWIKHLSCGPTYGGGDWAPATGDSRGAS